MPDDAVPRASLSGLSTASCATQWLRYAISELRLSTTPAKNTHVLLVVPVLLNVFHVGYNLAEKGPAITQTRVLGF
jgi:hypothetical protein